MRRRHAWSSRDVRHPGDFPEAAAILTQDRDAALDTPSLRSVEAVHGIELDDDVNQHAEWVADWLRGDRERDVEVPVAQLVDLRAEAVGERQLVDFLAEVDGVECVVDERARRLDVALADRMEKIVDAID